eukprot:13988474-Ditylum_brightwellii.AAC.1
MLGKEETNEEPKEGEKKEEEEKEKNCTMIESPDKKQKRDNAKWIVQVQGTVVINNYFAKKKEYWTGAFCINVWVGKMIV